LQLQRPKLPRDMKNNVLIPSAAFALVSIALGAAIVDNTKTIPVFCAYLCTLVVLMLVFTMRLKLMGVFVKFLVLCRCWPQSWIDRLVGRMISLQKESSVVYFSKTANISRLNKAIQYIRSNEDANHCRVVHFYDDERNIPQQLLQCCHIIDTVYPSIRVDIVFVKGVFGADMILALSKQWSVPPNLMFMTCPTSEVVGKRIQDLQGVRVIMSHEEDGFIDRYASGAGSHAITAAWSIDDLVEAGGLRSRALSDAVPSRFSLERDVGLTNSLVTRSFPNTNSDLLASQSSIPLVIKA